MIVLLILLYILIAFIVMTVWFIVDPSPDGEVAVMAFSVIWPITILIVILLCVTQDIRIWAGKIRKKYVSDK